MAGVFACVLPPTKRQNITMTNIETSSAIVKAADLGTDELACVIRTEIQKCRAAMANALAAAMNAGDALIAVKPKVLERGITWTKWLRENCLLAESTAKLYVQLACHRDQIEAELQRGVELSLRAARRLISKPASRNGRESEENEGVEQPSVANDTAVLIETWAKATKEMRQAFLDHIGVDAVLEVMSTVFGSDLRSRVPAPKKRKTLALRTTNSAHGRDHTFRQ
jgi:hypothetical protein